MENHKSKMHFFQQLQNIDKIVHVCNGNAANVTETQISIKY